MRDRGEAHDRRSLLIVAGLVAGAVFALLLLTPDAADVALAATTSGASVAAVSADLEVARVAGARDRSPSSGVSDLERLAVERIEMKLAELVDPRVAGWVEDLRDDHVKGNAMAAMRGLIQLPAGALPELEVALGSYDSQQRHFAAGVLRARCRTRKAAPSHELLQVSVDALRSGLAVNARNTWVGPLTSRSARFLGEHTVAARDMLFRGLHSGDGQQRFLSAYLLARARVPGASVRIAHELVQHLNDNRISGDALMATHGLYRLGEPVLPVMAEYRRYADDQARRLIDLVQLDLSHPPRSRRDLRARRGMHDASCLYHDPAIEYDLRRSPVPSFASR